MGIKFLCPKGHKLHVKSFLSGKKAICPKCGVQVTIPAGNQPAALDPADDSSAEDSSINILSSSLEASAVGSLAGAVETAPRTAERAPTAPSAAVSTPAPAAETVLAAVPPRDPLDEYPGAAWYVRPATGGQFGPASGEIMRDWIAQGRIGASSLIWRAGWPDWRAASGIFPQLGAAHYLSPMPKAPALAVPPAASNGPPLAGGILPVGQLPPGQPAANGSVLTTQSGAMPLAQAMRKRRRGNDLSLIASAILGLISIILVIVLILVFRTQGTPAEATAQDTPPPQDVTVHPPSVQDEPARE